MLCEETLDADVCVHASVVVCASRCCCGVTGLSRALCAALSYVKLHLRPRLCLALLSVLSRGPAPPRPICRVLLIVDHNAVTPRPFPTTGKLIVLLPSHSRPAIQPMREQHGGFLLASPTKSFRLKKTHTRTHKHTHYSSHDINDSQWQQHTLCGGTHCKHTHFFHGESWSRQQLFSPRQQQRCWLPVAAVGMAMAARKGDLRFEGCPGTRQSREGERERLGGGGRGRTHLRTPSSLVVTRGRGRWRRSARSKFGAQIKPKQTPINMTDAVTWAASMKRLVSLNKPV